MRQELYEFSVPGGQAGRPVLLGGECAEMGLGSFGTFTFWGHDRVEAYAPIHDVEAGFKVVCERWVLLSDEMVYLTLS